mmetsp:Transcript_13468/g.30865  ORF Transcript_13468/g.30865 Transcript_13468/m.30865 type:complete len:206 (+) Transcript_13468:148-765(+)
MTLYSVPSGMFIFSPAHLKNTTFCPGFNFTSTCSPSSSFPGPHVTTSAIVGFSLALLGRSTPPAVASAASSTRSSTRSWHGFICGTSSMRAAAVGMIPITSHSRSMQYSVPATLTSVAPIPNLLYSTVSPFLSPLTSGPTSAISPDVGLRCAASGSSTPPCVSFSESAVFTSTMSLSGRSVVNDDGSSMGFAIARVKQNRPRGGA